VVTGGSRLTFGTLIPICGRGSRRTPMRDCDTRTRALSSIDGPPPIVRTRFLWRLSGHCQRTFRAAFLFAFHQLSFHIRLTAMPSSHNCRSRLISSWQLKFHLPVAYSLAHDFAIGGISPSICSASCRNSASDRHLRQRRRARALSRAAQPIDRPFFSDA
jgi:hypothetical protein